MKTYETPENLLELLDAVVHSARQTRAYSSVLGNGHRLASLEDFACIPMTPIGDYRKKRLADVLVETSSVQWIVGRHSGRCRPDVAIVEDPNDPENRFEVLSDAIADCISGERPRRCAIVSSSGRSAFAAEIGMLVSSRGYPAHVFLDEGGRRTYEYLDVTAPDILVVLSRPLNEARLPGGIELCITFRQSQRMTRFQQLDVYSIDEFGFLAQSTDCQSYVLNNDDHYFERSEGGNLVVTALHNRVQPLIRLETQDKVKRLRADAVEFDKLSPDG